MDITFYSSFEEMMEDLGMVMNEEDDSSLGSNQNK
jgi:hypothetical protein